MKWRVRPSMVGGNLSVPGDKSIAHRSIMLAALADGVSIIHNLPTGGDVRATAACMQCLSATIDEGDGHVTVTGTGALRQSAGDLYAANSGTTMRLLAGILSGQHFFSRLTGDASLSRRPMNRVIEPLTRMGASIQSRSGKSPLEIEGRQLHGIEYRSPVASAQVKSAVLLAGLQADGETSVEEPVQSRDHTERMLRALGVPVSFDGRTVRVRSATWNGFTRVVPGDMSSAAYFFAASLLTEGEVTVRSLGINPTRVAFLQLLVSMGATVDISRERDEMGEPVADVTVGGGVNRPVKIDSKDVPGLIDELPLVALLATQATGTSIIEGAEELRVKETDRIAGTVTVLGAMGADITALPDGFMVRGPSPLRGATIDSGGDHRIAMLGAVAGMIAAGETTVEHAEATAVSFPGFQTALQQLGGAIHEA